MTKRMTPFSTACYWLVALVAIWTSSSTTVLVVEAKAKNLELLMVGNSFSEAHNMEEMIQSMLNERKIVLQANSVFAARFEEGGANLAFFAQSEQMATMISDRSWTWVVLQEQSQTSGFYPPAEYEATYENSLKSVLLLDREIQAVGGTTVLFQTWGYFGKDIYNPEFYPDYQTMQDKITRGYEIYREEILKDSPQAKVKIAPAGLAFDRIFKHIQTEEGKDPLEKGSLFDLLFEEEGEPRKHPSMLGSYLCGCVLFQTLTGLDVRQSSVAPPGLDPKIRNLLQIVAYDTVMEYNGGEASKASPKKYALPSSTPAPYVPSSEKGRSKSGSGGGGGFGKTFMTLVVVAGVGMTVWSRRDEIMAKTQGHRHQQQPYGFEPLSNGANMELSDFPGGGAHQPML